jgi:uncharacterized membrane protein AbrB (regulator of aidB expression)
MKTHVRILLIIAILALAAGWLGLRRGNAAIEKRLAARPAGTAEVAR